MISKRLMLGNVKELGFIFLVSFLSTSEIFAYDRQRAVEYANQWALSRNSAYNDYQGS